VYGNLTESKVLGTIRVAVIAAQFSDIKPSRTVEQLQNDYFGASHSVASYYHEVSYGQLTIVGRVFGWYTLPHSQLTYGMDCEGIDDADCTGVDGSWQIARDAVGVVKNDVNFTNYDYFVFLHSGYGEESGGVKEEVWSVAYLGEVSVQTNSGTLTKFDIVPEMEVGGAVPLGVYTHEFGHLLGLPDMYDTHTGKSMMGDWELMDSGLWNGNPHGSSPAELSSWSRIHLGWLSPNNVASYQLDATNMTAITPLEKVPTGNQITTVKIIIGDQEYYLFEDRQPLGNDAALPDHGVVGYHINEKDYDFSTIQKPAARSAFHLGNQTVVNQFRAKVIAAYANGGFLLGFGAACDTPTQQGSTLTITVRPIITLNATVNNQTYAANPSTGQIIIATEFANSTFIVTMPQTVPIETGEREAFRSWTDGNTSNTYSITVTSNTTLTASYVRQYLVSIASQHGTPVGSGWHDQNSTDTIALPSFSDASMGTRYRFASWTGDHQGSENPITIQVTKPMSINSTWITQFCLSMNTTGHGSISGNGWYDAGSTASFNLTTPQPENGTWLAFEGWSGDYDGKQTTGSLLMTKPMQITAKWATLELMHVNFYDNELTPIYTRGIDTLLLRAPNGTVISFANLQTNSAIWVANGTYQVLEATVIGIDTIPYSESFATSPNGVAKIQLNLYTLTFNVQDSIFHSSPDGGLVILNLPNGQTENATIKGGIAIFPQLPEAAYQYSVMPNWGFQSSGDLTLPDSQTVPVQVTAVSSVAIVSGVFIAVIAFSLILLKSRGAISLNARLRNRRIERRAVVSPVLQDQVYAYIIRHGGVISKSTAAKDLGIPAKSLDTVIAQLRNTREPEEIGSSH
jgi:M6 family metalloprotease-like protein